MEAHFWLRLRVNQPFFAASERGLTLAAAAASASAFAARSRSCLADLISSTVAPQLAHAVPSLFIWCGGQSAMGGRIRQRLTLAVDRRRAAPSPVRTHRGVGEVKRRLAVRRHTSSMPAGQAANKRKIHAYGAQHDVKEFRE